MGNRKTIDDLFRAAEGSKRGVHMLEKRTLSTAELKSQAAFELPDRDMMALINIIVFDVIDGGVLNNLTIEVKNNNVGAQVCAVVNLLSATAPLELSCTLAQR
jgi:hypothetical protein